MASIAHIVSFWRLLEHICLAALYGVVLSPFLRLAREIDLPGRTVLQLVVTAVVQAAGLLLAALFVHYLCRRYLAPQIRNFIWHHLLRHLEEHVASTLLSRSMGIHSWIYRSPGVIAVEGARVLLCSRQTAYDVLRLEIGDISRLAVRPELDPPLMYLTCRISYSDRCLRSTISFHDAEQTMRWFERLQPFLADDAEVRFGNA